MAKFGKYFKVLIIIINIFIKSSSKSIFAGVFIYFINGSIYFSISEYFFKIKFSFLKILCKTEKHFEIISL